MKMSNELLCLTDLCVNYGTTNHKHALSRIRAYIMDVQKPSHNKQSTPCNRCSDYELILDVKFCPFCGFVFVRG